MESLKQSGEGGPSSEARAALKWGLIFSAIPVVVGLGYLLAFFPGLMSFDSVAQWADLSTSRFGDWHPAWHTLVMWLITRLWYSPAAVAGFQVLVFGLVLAYTLLVLRQDFGVPIWLLLLVDLFSSLLPLNGLMVITLWKDVLYSIAVLLLTAYLLRIVRSRDAWLASGANWIWLGLVLANVALLRHNGAPVALGTAVVLLVLQWSRRYAALSLALAGIVYIAIAGLLYAALGVDRSTSQSVGVALVHPLAAQVNGGVHFTEAELAFLNRLHPLAGGWPYSCYDATVFFYDGVSFAPVQDEPLYAAEIFLANAAEDPAVTLSHFACLSSFVYEPRQPEGVYLETVLLDNLDVNAYPEWRQYRSVTAQSSRWPALRDLVAASIEQQLRLDPGRVFWRPAVYLYAFSLAVFACLIKGRKKLLWLLLVPVLLQSVVIAFTAQVQAVRYQYPVYLTSMLLCLPLLYLAIWKPSTLHPT